MIGWIDNLLKQSEQEDMYRRDDPFWLAHKRVNALNIPLPTVGLGLSETLSISTDELDFDGFRDTIGEMKGKLLNLMMAQDENKGGTDEL